MSIYDGTEKVKDSRERFLNVFMPLLFHGQTEFIDAKLRAREINYKLEMLGWPYKFHIQYEVDKLSGAKRLVEIVLVK
jgi:hypothetical protein